jgi:hypothetical protein
LQQVSEIEDHWSAKDVDEKSNVQADSSINEGVQGLISMNVGSIKIEPFHNQIVIGLIQ